LKKDICYDAFPSGEENDRSKLLLIGEKPRRLFP
jgi:hypothetical protein